MARRASLRLLLPLVALAGCAAPLHRRPADLDALLTAYRAQNASLAARRDSADRARIPRLDVTGPAGAKLVSLTADNAPVAAVVRRILDAAEQPYVFEGRQPSGSVTARLDARPMTEALSLVLETRGFTAAMRNGLIVIGPGAPTSRAGAATDTVNTEILIEHLEPRAISALLEGMAAQSGTRAVYDAARSRVIVMGARRDVDGLAALIRSADQAPPHVLIEALIVEFDVETLRELGISIGKGQSGHFSDLFFTPGNLTGALIQSLYQSGVTSPEQLVASIQALAGTDKAHVLARPYISAQSGDTALVNIGRTRFFVSQSFQAGVLTSAGMSVESGVNLQIAPVALAGGKVRMDVHVAESQFIPTLDNVASETDRNEAQTRMMVPSGQTIVIGGLALERRTNGNSGIPVLRHIPGLNLLTSQRSSTGKTQEVVAFLTPHIWDPGMDPPLAVRGAFTTPQDPKKIKP